MFDFYCAELVPRITPPPQAPSLPSPISFGGAHSEGCDPFAVLVSKITVPYFLLIFDY